MRSQRSIRRARPVLRSAIHLVLAAALALSAHSSLGHHSGALWDTSKTVSLEGTVKEFQWSNPHCWIQLLVSNAGAAANEAQEWSIEMAAPIQMLQGGWKPRTLKAGDRIRVSIHPARDGSRAGNFVGATSLDGRPLGSGPSEHKS